MTMPTHEYIEHQCTMQCAPNCTIQGASYIRADIAEELARALESMGDNRISYAEFKKIRNSALARFRAITP